MLPSEPIPLQAKTTDPAPLTLSHRLCKAGFDRQWSQCAERDYGRHLAYCAVTAVEDFWFPAAVVRKFLSQSDHPETLCLLISLLADERKAPEDPQAKEPSWITSRPKGKKKPFEPDLDDI